MAQMYSPGGQAIPSGLTGYGLQLWQSGYFDPPAAAPTPAPPPANQFNYDLTPLGQSMNGGAAQVAAAPMTPQPISMANMEAPTQAPYSPAQASPLDISAVNNYYRQNKHREITPDEWHYWQNSGQDLAAVDRSTKDGTYQFNTQQLLNGNQALGGWGDLSQGLGANQGTPDAAQWQHFTGTDGTPLAAYREFAPGAYDQSAQQPTQGALTGYRVFKDPGDFGGTGFKGGTDSRMNGIAYDHLDANGNFVDKGAFSGWTDSGIGDALGVGSIFAMAAGGALAAGAAGGAGAGAAAGAGGAAEGIGAAGAGFLGDATAAGYAGLDAASAATLGGGASGAYGGGLGLAGAGAGTTAMGAGAGTGTMPSLPLMDTTVEMAQPFIPTGTLPQLPLMDTNVPMSQPFVPSTPSLPNLPPTPPGAPPAAPPAAPPGVPPPANPNLPQGVPPPANPNVPGSSLIPGVTNSQLLGGATTALGALSGSQSGSGSGGAGGVLDERMTPFLYGSGGLLSQTQNTLNQQQPLAQAQSAQLASTGSGLLGKSIAGNGYGNVGTNVAANGYGTVGGPVAENGFGSGAVSLNAPTTSTNPYLSGMADDIGRRTHDMVGQSLNDISGHSVGVGGMGGSRQGVAQGGAIGKASDYLSGNLANMFGTQYNNDQNRALQQYGLDQNFYTAQRGQDLTGSAQNQAFYGQQRNSDIARAGQDQSFYNSQRGLDQSGAQLGGSLLGQSQSQAFAPLTSASGIYKPFSGLASSGDNGTNWSGLLGGALSGAALAGKLGWWGS